MSHNGAVGTLLTVGDVAEMFRKSRRTIQRMAERGELPYEHKLPGPNGSYLFSRQVVELIAKGVEK